MPAVPTLNFFEQITDDAAYEYESGNIALRTNTSPPNNWAPQGGRVVVHNDGTMRSLVTSWDSTNFYQWHIYKRTPAGVVTLEQSGLTTDEPVLLRHSPSDTAHLFAWPSSVLTVYRSTDAFATGATVLAGSFSVVPNTSRHYWGAGISEDGTAVIKVTVNTSGTYATQNTNIEYTTGTYNSGTGVWTWIPLIVIAAGNRHAYDFLISKPGGKSLVLGVSSHDVHYRVPGYEVNDPPDENGVWVGGTYVFNGASIWTSGVTSSAYFARKIGNIPTASNPLTVQSAPIVRVSDVWEDLQGRIFVVYHCQVDAVTPSNRGFYLYVSDVYGNQIHASFISAQITFGGSAQYNGNIKLYEDSAGRMWAIWANQGTAYTQLRLYRLEETVLPYSRRFGSRRKGPVSTFRLNTSFTDLNPNGGPMYDYAIDNYGVMLATPRCGNARSMFLRFNYNAFWMKHSDFYPDPYDSDSEDNYLGHGQRVFLVEYELPDV